MAKRNSQKQLDKQIEQIYYQHGSGVQINVLNIRHIFAAGRAAAAAGEPLEPAIVAAIAKWREN